MINFSKYSKIILAAFSILCFLSPLSKTFADEMPKSWTISKGRVGGIAGWHELFEVNSKGKLYPSLVSAQAGSGETWKLKASKITDSELAKLKALLEKAYPFGEDKKPDPTYPPNTPDLSSSWFTVTAPSGKPRSFYVSNPAVDAFISFFDELEKKYKI